ncbi:MAG: SCP2 sterol-binding domain-containing protein [Gammaproteobacteria bacterium]|nr:SCP2 sterol-binding domain-containing protein [Gammaproteobacteria bacterium]
MLESGAMPTETPETEQGGARLPGLLALPLRLVPGVVHSTALATVLDRVLERPLADGELEFLFGRTVAIRVEDAQVEYRLFLGVGGFYAGSTEREADVTMHGTLYDFLVLATGEEDPDTLFFQRRLRISGDTALGLQVKNLLDGLDLGVHALPESTRTWIDGALAAYRRLFGARVN